MPFIYIVEDDVNIREIQRYALRTVVLRFKNLDVDGNCIRRSGRGRQV